LRTVSSKLDGCCTSKVHERGRRARLQLALFADAADHPRESIGVCNEGLRFIFFIAVPFERSEFYLSSHLSCSLLCNQSEPCNLRSSL
jgi:hypothetical protein